MRSITRRFAWLVWVLSLALVSPHGALVRAQTQPAQKTQPATKTQTPATTATKTQPTATKAPAASTAAGSPPIWTNADTGWPRPLQLKTGTVLWYQPQVESWNDQKYIVAWSAVSYQPTGAQQPALGTIKIEGPSSVSVDERVVRMDLRISEYNFRTLSPDQVKALVADVQALPQNQRVIDLDRVLAYVGNSPLQIKNVEGLKADPPRIFWAPSPAMLISIDGEPIWSPVEGLDLRYVVNSNWDLFEHPPSKTFYVRFNQSWLQASAISGPWTPVKDKLPESFSKLPANDNWKDVKAAVPGKKLSGKNVPKVFFSTEPSEMIELQEEDPSYIAVSGTPTLLWVNNTESDLFRMGKTGDFYYLVAGRWFKAASLDGPWTFATPSLPEEFKDIPVEHPRSRVLASVPGTAQAMEGVVLASIPRTARVNKKQLKAPDVAYKGTPEFKPIEGSQGVQQAMNTDKDIVKVGDLYYMCFQAVWFVSKSANGPWEVASTVPKEIYTIPTSSSVNHVTYVTVEEDNDDEWVTFAYFAAYTGLMIGWGCAVWGSGWYYPPYYGGFYYGYPRTYGMGAYYNPYTGAYGRGYGAYGPYGGARVGSAYNPRTGTYARGGTVYGPGGSRSAAQAYNPRTGTYAQTRQGNNIYGNWGTSSVQRGDNWAQTAHKTNYQTGRTTSGIRTSEGGGAVRSSGPGGSGTIGRTGSGDVYAGRDGNVYRNTGSGWEQNNGSGGWNPVEGGGSLDQRNQNMQNRAGTNSAGDRAGAASTNRATSSAGSGGGLSGASSAQTGQLNRDSAARSSGNERTTNRSSWQQSGSTRSGAGSFGGGGRSRGGGGRRR
jgi:hypothetical protein